MLSDSEESEDEQPNDSKGLSEELKPNLNIPAPKVSEAKANTTTSFSSFYSGTGNRMLSMPEIDFSKCTPSVLPGPSRLIKNCDISELKTKADNLFSTNSGFAGNFDLANQSGRLEPVSDNGKLHYWKKKFPKPREGFAKQRIQQDLQEFCSEDLTGIWVTLTDDVFMWSVSFCGPTNSPFDGNICEAIVLFSENHPYTPPKVIFVTPIFHPNVYPSGEVCADGLLAENWSPCNAIWSLLLSVQFLLADPNPEIPANEIAAIFFKKSFKEYCKTARDNASATVSDPDPLPDNSDLAKDSDLECSSSDSDSDEEVSTNATEH